MPAVKGLRITVDKVVGEVECDGLADYQHIVGGFIEAVPLHTGDTMFVNEEGKLDGLPFNSIATDVALRVIGPRDYIAGDCVVVGPPDAVGDTTSISQAGSWWVRKVASEAGATWGTT